MRRAFSLIELLIVVIIIGVVYTLAVTNFKKISDASATVSLQNLKSYLQKFPHQKDVAFVCLDACEHCDVFVDGKKVQALEDRFENFIDDSIEVYRYDSLEGFQEQPKDLFFNLEGSEEQVCFSYKIDYRGIGPQLYIKFKDKVYDYSSYLLEVPLYDTLEDVRTAKEALYEKVLQ